MESKQDANVSVSRKMSTKSIEIERKHSRAATARSFVAEAKNNVKNETNRATNTIGGNVNEAIQATTATRGSGPTIVELHDQQDSTVPFPADGLNKFSVLALSKSERIEPMDSLYESAEVKSPRRGPGRILPVLRPTFVLTRPIEPFSHNPDRHQARNSASTTLSPAPLASPLGIYNRGISAKKDGKLALAKELFAKATEKGHPKATHNLAVLVSSDEPEEASRLFRAAAFQGLSEAQFMLAVRLQSGVGIPMDKAEACTHFRRAAAQGHVRANFELGLLLEKGGAGVTATGFPDVAGARRCLEAAARAGDDRACVNLGRLLESSADVQAQGWASAWYRQASARGDATAAFNLAMCHCFGVGGAPKDPLKAVRLLEQAAAKGHPKACYNLACRKLRGGGAASAAQGGGVDRDVDGAIALLRVAAASGLDKPAKALRAVLRDQKERAEDRSVAAAAAWRAAERDAVRRSADAPIVAAAAETTPDHVLSHDGIAGSATGDEVAEDAAAELLFSGYLAGAVGSMQGPS